MKKTILLVLALGACAISQGQNVSKTTTTVVETKEVGDSTITTKIITTTENGKTTTEKEINVSRYVEGNKFAEVEKPEPESTKKRTKFISGLSFTGSFLNDNKAINNKLAMRNINDFNYGLLFNIGGVTPFGLEIVMDLGFEGSTNKSNN